MKCKKLSVTDQIKRSNAEPGCKIYYWPPFKLLRFSDLVVELQIIHIKSMVIGIT